MHAVAAHGISAAGLSLVLVNVNPPLLVGFFQLAYIIRTEGRNGLKHNFSGAVKAVRAVNFLSERRIQVIGFHVIDAEGFLFQGHIVMKRREVVVDRLDKPIVYRHRDFIPEQRGLQGRLVMTQACEGHVFFDAGRVRGAQRVAELCKCAVNSLKSLFAHSAHRRGNVPAVGLLGQGLLFSVGIGDLAEAHVGVGQHGETFGRRARQIAHGRHDGLLAGRKDVLLLAENAAEHQPVRLKFRLLADILLYFPAAAGKNLRRHKSALLADFHIGLHRTVKLGLRPFGRRILIVQQRSIGIYFRHNLFNLFARLNCFKKRGRTVHHMPLQPREIRSKGHGLFQIGFPQILRGINIRKVPGVFHGHLGSLRIERNRPSGVAAEE